MSILIRKNQRITCLAGLVRYDQAGSWATVSGRRDEHRSRPGHDDPPWLPMQERIRCDKELESFVEIVVSYARATVADIAIQNSKVNRELLHPEAGIPGSWHPTSTALSLVTARIPPSCIRVIAPFIIINLESSASAERHMHTLNMALWRGELACTKRGLCNCRARLLRTD